MSHETAKTLTECRTLNGIEFQTTASLQVDLTFMFQNRFHRPIS